MADDNEDAYKIVIHNDFLRMYLKMVENTESPRVYHVWSALSGVAAALGRRCGLPFGAGLLYPNLYVLLVGTAAARKSTAVNIMSRIVRANTGIRFAPEDTGGKRQGLVAAMTGEDDADIDVDDMHRQLNGAEELTLENLGNLEINVRSGLSRAEANPDEFHIYVVSSEFNSFIGYGNTEFLTFLGKMYDGEPYDYRLKNKKDKLVLEHPLVNLIGCTTPTNIAEAFPQAAVGQGFTSRVIFVHGGKKHRSIPWPTPFATDLVEAVGRRYSEINYNLRGPFSVSDAARRELEDSYEADHPLTDGRFTYYLARRYTHLLKLTMVFAAARGTLRIEKDDAWIANALLNATEKTMPDALGEYGMSAVSAAQQKILEYITHSKEPITTDLLWTFMQRDIKHHELANCINSLITTGKIQQVRRGIDNKVSFIPNMKVAIETLELMDLLITNATTERLQ